MKTIRLKSYIQLLFTRKDNKTKGKMSAHHFSKLSQIGHTYVMRNSAWIEICILNNTITQN